MLRPHLLFALLGLVAFAAVAAADTSEPDCGPGVWIIEANADDCIPVAEWDAAHVEEEIEAEARYNDWLYGTSWRNESEEVKASPYSGPWTPAPQTVLDSSGNGLDLTVNGTNEARDSAAKYEEGLFLPRNCPGCAESDPNHLSYLLSADPALQQLGNLSLFARTTMLSSTGSTRNVMLRGLREPGVELEANNYNYQLVCNGFASPLIRYRHEFGVGSEIQMNSAATFRCIEGYSYSFSLTRDAVSRRVKLWLNQTLVVNATYSALQAPTGGADGTFVVAGDLRQQGGLNSPLTGEIYEARIWSSIVNETNLLKLADPLDPTYQGVALGGELGLWFLENRAPDPADAGPDQLTAQPGETVLLDACSLFDLDGNNLTVTWVQTAGPAASLNDTTSCNVEFVMPHIDRGDDLVTFQVTVTDGLLGDTDTVTIGHACTPNLEPTKSVIEGPIMALAATTGVSIALIGLLFGLYVTVRRS